MSSIAPWHLPSALSRAGAAALPGGRVLLLGGLFASGGSSADVGVLDLETGALTSVATLASPTHDAGSAVLGGRAFLFGGGQAYPVATVEAVTLPGGSSASGGAGIVTGQLPQPRADDEAVTVAGTAYVVGGYDGATGDTAVLATQNGSSYSTVATLPVDVRYGAVAAAGGKIYVFGGETVPGGTTLEYSTPTPTTSPPPGQQVALVQQIDPQTHTARVAGYLPRGVQGAAAFVLGGKLFLAGGDSNAPGTPPSSGSTIWSFDPSTGAFRLVGHLAAPVAYAAVVVEGGTAWLVGGERDGVPIATVQKVVLRRSS
ncbi:MAG: Kelch repeat-containing protein [Acidimicrobiales bacterium]